MVKSEYNECTNIPIVRENEEKFGIMKVLGLDFDVRVDQSRAYLV